MKSFHTKGLSDTQLMSEYMKVMHKLMDHSIECHGVADNRPNKSHRGNGTYNGAFAFTLTKSDSDELSEEDMVKAVRKIVSQKSCPVIKYAWYLEYKDVATKKHPHIHGMYETQKGGRIEQKHFKRAWAIWNENVPLGRGFRGGYHRPVNHDDSYQKYISKSGGLGDSMGVEEIISPGIV